MELIELDRRIAFYDQQVRELYRNSELCQRLGKIEGIGPVTATALIAAVIERASRTAASSRRGWGLSRSSGRVGVEPNCLASANAAIAICGP